jgi:putative DNA-invertase from lambdoid prophage Rac
MMIRAWPEMIVFGHTKHHSKMPVKRTPKQAKSHEVLGQARKQPKMFRAGLYARVSTLDQQTLPMQMRALRDYANKRGWIVAMQVKEVGSGAVERELRQQLIDAARRREIDVVLVWRLDRWGRSLMDLVTTLQELSDLNVGFVSLTEALDLTTSTGRAMAGMLAVFAEFERDILREWVRAGLAEARRNGQRLGRPTPRRARPPRCANSFAKALANPKSPGGWRLDAPPSVAFWPNRFPGGNGPTPLSFPTHAFSVTKQSEPGAKMHDSPALSRQRSHFGAARSWNPQRRGPTTGVSGWRLQ